MRQDTDVCSTAEAVAIGRDSTPGGHPLPLARVLRTPLPHLKGDWLTRFLLRSFLATFRSRVLAVHGLEHALADKDPFILALNHNQRLEAILVPALLTFLRHGKRVHFLADWNFLLVPGVALLFRAGQVIPIARKPAKPAFLNIFKPLLTDPEPGFDRARRRLDQGDSVGIFPEGTANRNPSRLLKGYSGAAQLSLVSKRPILPAGIRFPKHPSGKPISDWARLELVIGKPMHPPAIRGTEPDLDEIRAWHAQIMREISNLSGKPWNAQTRRKSNVVEE